MENISIIGGGILSMISAISLARIGFRVSILEKKKSDTKNFLDEEIRTLAITNSSKDFLSKMNIWNKTLEQYASSIKDVYVIDNMSNNMINFNYDLIKNQDQIGFVIKYQDFYKFLLSYINAEKNIEIINAEHIETNGNSESNKILINQKDEISSVLTLINTGNKSSIHKKYFLVHLEKDYMQNALTFFVYHEKPHEGTAVEHFVTSSTFAILPMLNPHISSIVWSVNSNYGKHLINLDKKILTSIIQEKFGEFLGSIKIHSKIKSIPLVGYLSKNYINKRFIAIGSSLHIIHPLAGQGLNLSIMDIKSLCNILSLGSFSNEQLKSFYDQRYHDNLNMFFITDLINGIFSNNSKIFYSARQIAFKLLEKSNYLKSSIMKYAMGYRY